MMGKSVVNDHYRNYMTTAAAEELVNMSDEDTSEDEELVSL